MKPVIELIRRTDDHNKSDPTELFACGKCGRLCSPSIYFASAENALAAARDMAERCCEPVKCDCGAICETKYRTACDACIARVARAKFQEKLDKAEGFTVETAPDGPVVDDNGEEFAHNIGDLLEKLSYRDIDKDVFPLYAWMCELRTPQFDLDNIGQRFHEDLELHEDAEVEGVCTDLHELKDAIVAWNAKQKPTMWWPDTKQYIVIQYEDVYPPEKEKEAP